MMDRPTECVPCGTYQHTVPMACNGRVAHVDFCLADIVAALNAGNLPTVASCCGHPSSKTPACARVDLADGRCLLVLPSLLAGNKAQSILAGTCATESRAPGGEA